MMRNYFKSAWRNITRNKLYFTINIAGLSIGMAACILILQYVNFEFSYDKFNRNAGDIYRVVNDRYQEGQLVQHSTMTYSAIGKALQDDYPEVINYMRVSPLSSRILISGTQKIVQNGLAVDSSFFSMFSYPLIAGNKDQALKEPTGIILSETAARKIFTDHGNNFSSIIGRLINIERDSIPYKITAICQDAPANSHLQFDFLLPYFSLYSGGNKFWKRADHSFTESYFWHYIQLKNGVDHRMLEQKLPAFSDRYFQGNKVSGSIEKFYLQPLLKAHLYSDFQSDIAKPGSVTIVWGALISAILIIGIAWINYVNLATARSMERAKEVGVRKSTGATRAQLILQFFLESLLSNIISIFLAACLIHIFQDSFNKLVQQDLSLANLFQEGMYGKTIAVAFILLIISGIFISGFYPALVLSSFNPVTVLKGKLSTSSRGNILRKTLVVGQFAITIALVTGSIVIYQQLRYANNKNLGIDISQVLVINPPHLSRPDSGFINKERSFKEELKKLAHVKVAANSGRVPGDDLHKTFDVHRTDIGSANRFTMSNMSAGEEFMDVYGISLAAGRNFMPTDYSHDLTKARNIILNESATQLLGFSSAEEAVGKSLGLFESRYQIIGVVKNFHQKSLHSPLEPIVLMANYSIRNPISVKVATEDLANTIAGIKKIYDHFFPGNVFDYHFLDDKFNEQYNKDQLFGKVLAIFAGFAVLIASLGLLGLSLMATIRRTKEIGVRKVLGASTVRIVLLLSVEFIKLIMIAFIIGSPVTWLAMHGWLSNFAYRIDLDIKVFIAAGLLALFIALATISFQTIKAALANPVKSLRSE